MSPSSPQMSPVDFEKKAGALFREYFENDDLEEVAYTLGQFNIKNIKHQVNTVTPFHTCVWCCHTAAHWLKSLCLTLSDNSTSLGDCLGEEAVLLRASLSTYFISVRNSNEFSGDCCRLVQDDKCINAVTAYELFFVHRFWRCPCTA